MRGTTNIPDVAVIIRKGNKILFVLRQNTGWSDGMYCLPGGHVEPGESFSTAAVREAHEEVNVIVEDMHAVHTVQRIKTPDDVRIGVFFEVTKWNGEVKNMEPAMHKTIAWFDADALPIDTIVQFQADTLAAMQRGSIYTEVGW